MNLRRHSPFALLALAALATSVAAACNSKADSVCENVAACEQGGSSELVQSCQDEAKLLESAAKASSCGAAYDDYYECADSKFTCNGATASFPGCDALRATLDDCLARNAASNACGALAKRTATCHTVDAGDVNAPAPACTAARECAAQCYLSNVSDPCAPRPDELSSSAACTQSCPP